jgi:hypothetical protein
LRIAGGSQTGLSSSRTSRRLHHDWGFFFGLGSGDGSIHLYAKDAHHKIKAERERKQTYVAETVGVVIDVRVLGAHHAELLKRAVEACLVKAGRHIRGSIYKVEIDELRSLVKACAHELGLALYDETAFLVMEQTALEREMGSV